MLRRCSVFLGLAALHLTGCGAPPPDDGTSSAGAATTATGESAQDEAGAFSTDFTVGWLTGARFHALPTTTSDLIAALPEGDARTYARCLEKRRADAPLGDGRRDTVHGDSLVGSTWEHAHARFYVLLVDVSNTKGLRNLQMAFVFAEDGASRFQALTWDNRTNIQLAFRDGAPCVS
jgi:hypothetical protein